MSFMEPIDNARRVIAAYRKRRAIATAYIGVFGSPEGKMVLHDILRAGGILEPAHQPGDPYQTAFNDGRRSLALHIIERLRWSEGELEELALEQTAERLAQARED